ncbi:hypothetical protein ACFLZI_02620, partial [Nitrospirota bacterium]
MNRADIRFDNASYIDPTGRVFFCDNEVFRAFYPDTSEFYRNLISSPLIKDMMGKGQLVKSEPSPELNIDGFDLIVKHQRLPFPNYCFEWSMTQLKDAAKLTLEIASEILDDGLVLQDATPYNIFFDFSKPVF